MDLNDVHPTDDYSHRFFIWHEWIQANGPLTADNAFEYFTTSMFYDKQSNNQVLRMQTMHTGMPIINEAEELKRFTGIEFALVHAEPPSFFIIHKRERTSPVETKPLAAYFIVNNRIYQSPDVYSVLSNRLLTSLYSLRASLNVLSAAKPEYTPRTGFVWPIQDPNLSSSTTTTNAAEEESSKKPNPEDGPTDSELTQSLGKGLEGSQQRRQKNSGLLLRAMFATAARSKRPLAAETTTAVPAVLSSSTPTATTSVPTNAAAAESSMNNEDPDSATSPKSPFPMTGLNAPQTPASAAPTPGEFPQQKGPPGGGKKKRKRTGMSPPA